MPKTLYLCYFGLREPLVQTQVLPYLRELAKISDFHVNLLTFEPQLKKNWATTAIELERKKLLADGIEWHTLAYHKRPSVPATIYDVLNGVRVIYRLHRNAKIDILHARSHVPLMMALFARRLTRSKIIFDIRGLLAEEYADSGIWREDSVVYRMVKAIERKGIETASQIVVLTERLRDYLVRNKLKSSERIEVIPCCVNWSEIRQQTEAIAKNDRFELIYAGSVTGLYLLPEMAAFFLELKKRKPNAFFRVLTASSPDFVHDTFRKMSVSDDDFAVQKAAPQDVVKHIAAAHAGISFRKPTFAQIAASPTKIPEYLACGLPVVSNIGVGDTDALLQGERVGIIVRDFQHATIEDSVNSLVSLLEDRDLPDRCRELARERFDLMTVGRTGYANVYERLRSGAAE